MIFFISPQKKSLSFIEEEKFSLLSRGYGSVKAATFPILGTHRRDESMCFRLRHSVKLVKLSSSSRERAIAIKKIQIFHKKEKERFWMQNFFFNNNKERTLTRAKVKTAMILDMRGRNYGKVRSFKL